MESITQIPDIWTAITAVAGANARVISSSDRDEGRWLVRGDAETVVVKRFRRDHSPEQLRRALATAVKAGVRCPSLIQTVESGDVWYALYRYLAGTTPEVDSAAWPSVWRDAFRILTHLHAGTGRTRTTGETIERRWLRTFERTSWEGEGARLLEWLRSHQRAQLWTFAHGDFAPQNFVCTSSGLAVIDWDDAGEAVAGFDAGWLMALNRIGAGPRLERSVLLARLADVGPSPADLRWSEALGLLRLDYRARSLVSDELLGTSLQEMTRAAVDACAAEIFG